MLLRVKGGQKISRAAHSSEVSAVTEIVTNIKAKLCATTWEHKVVNASFGPTVPNVLRPFRHTIDQHAADEVVRFVMQQRKAELTPHSRGPPVPPTINLGRQVTTMSFTPRNKVVRDGSASQHFTHSGMPGAKGTGPDLMGLPQITG